MVYIYRKKIKRKTHFYVRESKQIMGKTITKDLFYLGTNEETMNERWKAWHKEHPQVKMEYAKVRKLVSELRQVNTATKTTQHHLAPTNAIIEHWRNIFPSYDANTKTDILNTVLVEIIYNNTTTTLTKQQLTRLLINNKTPANKPFEQVQQAHKDGQEYNKLIVHQDKEVSDLQEPIFLLALRIGQENYKDRNAIDGALIVINTVLAENHSPPFILDKKQRTIFEQLVDNTKTIHENTELFTMASRNYTRNYWRLFL